MEEKKTEQSLPIYEPVTIIVVGPSQVGKSTFINKLFGIRLADVGKTGQSCTQYATRYLRLIPDVNVMLMVDTPGISDTILSDTEIEKRILDPLNNLPAFSKSKCILLIDKLIASNTGPASHAADIAKKIKDLFGGGCEIFIVFTHSKIYSATDFPNAWRKEQKTKKKHEIFDLYLGQRLNFFGTKLGKCEHVLADFGDDDDDDEEDEEDNNKPIKDINPKDIFNFIAENYPALVPHLTEGTDSTISSSAKKAIGGVMAGAGVAGSVGTAAVLGLTLTASAVAIIPATLFFGGLWMMRNATTTTKEVVEPYFPVYILRLDMLWQVTTKSQVSLKKVDGSTEKLSAEEGFIFRIFRKGDGIFIKHQNLHLCCSKKPLGFPTLTSAGEPDTFTIQKKNGTTNSHEFYLKGPHYYLSVNPDNFLTAVETVNDATAFAFMTGSE